MEKRPVPNVPPLAPDRQRPKLLPAHKSKSFHSLFILGLLALLIAKPSFALREGDKLPNFLLPTATGKKIDLAKYAASQKKKNLLLLFFRTGTCGVCLSQLQEYARYAGEFEMFNAAVLAVSLDDAIVQANVSRAIENKFPVMLDPQAKLTNAFDVLNPEEKLARPSIFLVDSERVIRYAYVGMAIQDRPPIALVLEMVKHYSGLAPTKRSVSSGEKK